MKTNIKVIGLTRHRIKPKSTVPKTNALATWQSELYFEVTCNSCIFIEINVAFNIKVIAIMQQEITLSNYVIPSQYLEFVQN